MTANDIVDVATTKIGNGVTRRVVWISTAVIVLLAGTIFLVSGKYTYVMSTCSEVAQLKKDGQDTKLQLTEIRTDLKWVKNRLGYKEEK